MMKFCVEGITSMHHNEVISIVESIDTIRPKYVPNGSPVKTTLVFEVDTENEKDSVHLIKDTIKKTEIGKKIKFRVYPYGKPVYFG